MFLEIFFSWPFVVFFSLFLRVTFFCHDLFLFPVSYFLLSRQFFFSHELSSFAVAFFVFALSIFLLPRDFFFCRELFSFAVTNFFFAGSICLLPREFFFCRELFCFAERLDSLISIFDNGDDGLLLGCLTGQIRRIILGFWRVVFSIPNPLMLWFAIKTTTAE